MNRNYFYRSLISVMMVAQAFREQDLLKELYSFRQYFEEQSGRTEWEHPEKLIKKIKNKEAQQKNRGDSEVTKGDGSI